MCPSFGSLKTEEKTERQCGQFVRGGLRVSEIELLVNSAAGPTTRWQQILEATNVASAISQIVRQPEYSTGPNAR